MLGTNWVKVDAEMLKRTCPPEIFPFKDTSEIDPAEGLIGQERALRAINFGLDVPIPGYNVFITGPNGIGKATLAKQAAHQKAMAGKAPDDWCYVFNFKAPDRPISINLPAGTGRKLAHDLEKLISQLKQMFAQAFNGEDFDTVRNKIMSEFFEETSEMYTNLEQLARGYNFSIARNQGGIATIPLIDGKPISPEDFNNLNESEKERILGKGKILQEKINEAMRKYKDAERALRHKLQRLEKETARRVMAPLFAELYEKYRSYEKVVAHLENMHADIIEHLDLFVEHDDSDSAFMVFKRFDRRNALRRYQINLLVDNSELNHKPVIVENNPTYANLFGSIEYEHEFGILATDFTKIRPGAIHKANGGYLIITFNDVIRNFMAWETLERILKTGEITIESAFKSLSMGGAETLQPEPIPVNLKVIVIGEPIFYYLLRSHDNDFEKIFKVKVEFDIETDRNDENIINYARFVSRICRQHNLPHFTVQAVARIVDYGTWLAEDQRKLSVAFNKLEEIIVEAATWARLNGKNLVDAAEVEKALEEKVYRSNMLEEKILDMIKDGTIMLEVSGKRAGEINGLAVYSIGDYMFGKPSRITAKTFMGERGVINIEREVRMSGTIHNKGVLTLGGYLGAKYAQDKPLSLSASLTFEQTYDGIEGDSASSAELFAIISSLSGKPINQGIAVTGSVNQNGEIQPIGAVNQKIEGYYRACKIKGLDGTQGVIIPYKNLKNLMLSPEIVKSVENKMFNIWAIEDVDQGIEILMDTPAGKLEPNGEYTKGSVHYLVNRRLREWGDYRKSRSTSAKREYPQRRTAKRRS